MARRKAASRVPPITRGARRAGSAWDREFLGDNRYNITAQTSDMPGQNNRRSLIDLPAVQERAEKLTDIRLEQEIEAAILGDDRELLPYQPTPTINPGRPRTLAAGYDERSQTLRIKFRDGDYYTYYNIPPSVWWKFQRAQSPGRFINTTLERYPYNRGLY